MINCAGRQVPNHWESIGVKYLTYFWLDQDNQLILDTKGQIANECYEFITKALENGDSVLVHSVKGQSRSFTIIAMWIMRRYQWRLAKTLQFLNSRRPDLDIRPNFIHQLTAYENRLISQGLGPKTSTWNEVTERNNHFENEELLLRNTYLNAQMGPMATLPSAGERRQPPRLRWADDLKERAPLVVVMEENVVAPKVPENKGINNELLKGNPLEIKNTYSGPTNYIEEIDRLRSKGQKVNNSTAAQESKDLVKTQYQDQKPPKTDAYAEELLRKYIGSTKNNENPSYPKDPFYNKYDITQFDYNKPQYNPQKYENEQHSNTVKPQQSSYTDTRKVQNLSMKQGDMKMYADPSASFTKYMNTKEQGVREQRGLQTAETGNDLKYQRAVQYTKPAIEMQGNDSKYVEPKKYKYTEVKSNDALFSNVMRQSENKQLKTSDKFNKYIRAADNGTQYTAKQTQSDTNARIAKSINQMLDLNEAMNKRLYQEETYTESQAQKPNFSKRPPSAQDQIKKVIPPKRTNTRPSSATIKRDQGIPKPGQR